MMNMAQFPLNKNRLMLLLMILVLLVATFLRFHNLGTQSLWHDEGNSYVQSTRSFAEIADNASRDIHPPGYYWVLAIWRGLTGDSEFSLRSLSAFASILSVVFTYALGVRLYGRMTGIVASVIVMLNTFSLYYAQETRMYALLTLWGVVSIWAFVGFIQANSYYKWRWGLALALFNVAGLYTQYAFPFVMFTQGTLMVLWVGAQVIRRYSAINDDAEPVFSDVFYTLIAYVFFNLLTILLYLPWLGTAWEQVTNWPSTGESIPLAEVIPIILARLSFGITIDTGTTAAVFFFLLFGLLVFPANRLRNSDQDYRQQPVWWWMLVPVLWVIITIGIFLALDLFRESNLKFLLPAQIGFALWIGRGVWILWTLRVKNEIGIFRYIARIAAVFGFIVLILGQISQLNAFYTDSAYQRDDYREIIAVIEAEANDDDAIILSAPNQQEVFDYYYGGELPVFPLPRGLGGDDSATLAEVQSIIDDYDRVYAILWAVDERDPNNIVEGTLDTNAFEIDSTWYGHVRLVRYVTPATFTTRDSVNIGFGDFITLQTVAMSVDSLQASDVLQIQFEWMTSQALQTRYKVFVQLLSPDGFVVTQRDAEPQGGLLPTIDWLVDEAIVDNHAIVIPSELNSGTYTLIMGLYDINDPSTRLAVNDSDHFVLQSYDVP